MLSFRYSLWKHTVLWTRWRATFRPRRCYSGVSISWKSPRLVYEIPVFALEVQRRFVGVWVKTVHFHQQSWTKCPRVYIRKDYSILLKKMQSLVLTTHQITIYKHKYQCVVGTFLNLKSAPKYATKTRGLSISSWNCSAMLS